MEREEEEKTIFRAEKKLQRSSQGERIMKERGGEENEWIKMIREELKKK